MDNAKIHDMTTGNPIKEILYFAIPMFIGNIFQQIYSVVDTMVAGYCLGDSAIASIGVTAALYSFIVSFSIGMNSGSALVLTRSIGAGNKSHIRKNIAGMILINVLITVLLTAVTCGGMKWFLHAIHTPEDIYLRAYRYMMVLCAGTIATVMYNMFASILRAFGNSKTALYYLILASILNVVLDYACIAILNLDVMGAALATVVAQLISGLLSMGYVLKNYREYFPKDFTMVEGHILRDLFSSGMAMALMYCANDLGTIIFTGANNLLGTMYITAHTTARRIILIMMQPLGTIAQAYATFVGQNYGARAYDRIKNTTKKVLLLEIGWAIAAFLLIFVFGEGIVRLITGTNDVQVIENAVFSIRFQHAFYAPLGVLLCIRVCLQAMGEKVYPVTASGIEMGLKIVFAYFLIPKIGFLGTVITEPIIWIICGIYILVIYLWKKKALLGDSSSEKVAEET